MVETMFTSVEESYWSRTCILYMRGGSDNDSSADDSQTARIHLDEEYTCKAYLPGHPAPWPKHLREGKLSD